MRYATHTPGLPDLPPDRILRAVSLLCSQTLTLVYLRFVANRFFRTELLPHAVEQRVEWAYAFDVHCNSFFPLFIVLYATLPISRTLHFTPPIHVSYSRFRLRARRLRLPPCALISAADILCSTSSFLFYSRAVSSRASSPTPSTPSRLRTITASHSWATAVRYPSDRLFVAYTGCSAPFPQEHGVIPLSYCRCCGAIRTPPLPSIYSNDRVATHRP